MILYPHQVDGLYWTYLTGVIDSDIGFFPNLCESDRKSQV